jgi:DNA ligase (NAD+)
MTSLPKVREQSEIKPLAEGQTRSYQLKMDGSSLEVHYDAEGKFDFAASRGDYTYGDNRTPLVQSMISINKISPTSDFKNAAVRGELIVNKKDMLVIAEEFTSQRSASSGIANRNNPSYAKYLTFVPYDVVYDNGRKVAYPDVTIEYPTFEKAQEAFEDELYPCDGVVIKDYSAKGDKLNENLTYAVAYKFADRTVETILRDVRWQIGKTGKLTPIAIFDTVFLDADVSKASLGSYRLFKQFNLHYGDKITVKKANMVIPQVVENLGGGEVSIEAPKYWNGDTTFIDGAHLRTKKSDKWKDVMYAQASSLMGKGLAGSAITLCIEKYGCENIYEAYDTLLSEEFSGRGIGERKKELYKEAAKQLSKASMAELLSSLQIDGISWAMSLKIMEAVAKDAKDTEKTQFFIITNMKAPYSFALSLSGFGEKSAMAFANAFEDIKEQFNLFYNTFGYPPADYDDSKQTSVDSSKVAKVVATGRFTGNVRKDIVRKLNESNIEYSNTVDETVDFLLAGRAFNVKKKKIADDLKIPTIYVYEATIEDAIKEVIARKANN